MHDPPEKYEDKLMPDDGPSPEMEQADLDDRPLHEILGIEVNYAADEESPPIDEQRLLAFVRNRLSPEEHLEVIHLMAKYRPWLRAWNEMLRRELREGQ
ncbi:MAG TPA: hypothetical protein VKU82_16425 [Planctomycetaceae bacterium]|nr:hypothetical protein [Planctomycetaceae bacterium]